MALLIQPSTYGFDVGTSFVRCVVGIIDTNSPGKMSVVGHGSARNLGMRRGVVAHVDDVTEAIVQALTEAERVSGMRIHGATVNINGSHINGMNSKGVIAISAANREIGVEDRIRVGRRSTIVSYLKREIMQYLAKNYRLDGRRKY